MLKGGASPLGTIPLCSTSGDWAPEHCGSLPITGTDSCSLERHGGTWSLQKLPRWDITGGRRCPLLTRGPAN